MISPTLANRIIFILALAGAAVTLILTISHAAEVELPCGRTAGCGEVAKHYTSNGFGIPALKAIPTAAFGLAGYVLIATLSFVRVVSSSPSVQKKVASLQWALALFGVAVSAWLTYLEAYVIHAWCKYCVASAVLMTLVFITSSAERFGRRREPAALLPEGEVS